MSITIGQIVAAIIDEQKAMGLSDKDLTDGIMNTTSWWRIRTKQSDITLSHALQLFDRLNLSWELYRPKQIIVSNAIHPAKQGKTVG